MMNSSSLPGQQTLRRGLQILAVLRQAGPSGMRIPDIAAATGIQRTSVYRFMDALEAIGCVVRDPSSKIYCVTQDWAMSLDPARQATDKARLALRRISDRTGDSAFLVCRSGTDSVCIHREVGQYPVQILAVDTGHRQPLGVGAAGLALLAALPPDETAEIIEQNAPRLLAYGGMTAEQMHLLVRTTRDRGWSVVGNAAVQGAIGVGVAMNDAQGRPVLAVSVSSTIDRMPSARQKIIAEWIARELA